MIDIYGREPVIIKKRQIVLYLIAFIMLGSFFFRVISGAIFFDYLGYNSQITTQQKIENQEDLKNIVEVVNDKTNSNYNYKDIEISYKKDWEDLIIFVANWSFALDLDKTISSILMLGDEEVRIKPY